MSGLLYKPVGLVLGFVASAVAGKVFKKAWHVLSGEDETPKATDESREWLEVLAAAALQGIIFSVVQAAVERAGAEGMRRLTGTWPA